MERHEMLKSWKGIPHAVIFFRKITKCEMWNYSKKLKGATGNVWNSFTEMSFRKHFRHTSAFRKNPNCVNKLPQFTFPPFEESASLISSLPNLNISVVRNRTLTTALALCLLVVIALHSTTQRRTPLVGVIMHSTSSISSIWISNI